MADDTTRSRGQRATTAASEPTPDSQQGSTASLAQRATQRATDRAKRKRVRKTTTTDAKE